MFHELFQLTTADENVEADLRAATVLNQEVAAQERCSHIENRIFMEESFHAPSNAGPRNMKKAILGAQPSLAANSAQVRDPVVRIAGKDACTPKGIIASAQPAS